MASRLDVTLGTVTRTDAAGVYVELDREPGSEYGPCQAITDPIITVAATVPGVAGGGSHTHAVTSRYTKGRRVAVVPLDGIADVLLILGPVT